jgi:hypothetical protein
VTQLFFQKNLARKKNFVWNPNPLFLVFSRNFFLFARLKKMLGRNAPKQARRVLDLKYLATFRSSVRPAPDRQPDRPAPDRVPDGVPDRGPNWQPERQPERQPEIIDRPLERASNIQAPPAWPHYVFATSREPQPCFDQADRPVDGAELEEDERVLLVLQGDVCRTTRVATTGEMVTARVDKNKFKDFQPLP